MKTSVSNLTIRPIKTPCLMIYSASCTEKGTVVLANDIADGEVQGMVLHAEGNTPVGTPIMGWYSCNMELFEGKVVLEND